MKPNFEHWWEKRRDKAGAQRRASADHKASKARQEMKEAAAFIYELVRRLTLCQAAISSADKEVLAQLPMFTDLDSEQEYLVCSAIWSFWELRPIAHSLSGPILSGGLNPHALEHYAQMPFHIDLTAELAPIMEVVKFWYHHERKRRGISTHSKREAIPFRVTWSRINCLEAHYGSEKNRRRERTIELAKNSLPAIVNGWHEWKKWKTQQAKQHQPDPSEYIEDRSAGIPPWPRLFWKEVSLSEQPRPSRSFDRGYEENLPPSQKSG
jgi:hypothetical protein